MSHPKYNFRRRGRKGLGAKVRHAELKRNPHKLKKVLAAKEAGASMEKAYVIPIHFTGTINVFTSDDPNAQPKDWDILDYKAELHKMVDETFDKSIRDWQTKETL